MPKVYGSGVSDDEVLATVLSGNYTVDFETGEVFNKFGRPLTPFACRRGYLFVRIHCGELRKGVAVHRLIWMARTGQVIPPDFEIHHFNEDITDNEFSNLVCVHKIDHLKFHQKEEVPF